MGEVSVQVTEFRRRPVRRCTRVKVIRVEVSKNVVTARTKGWTTSTRPGKLRDFGLQPRRSNPRRGTCFEPSKQKSLGSWTFEVRLFAILFSCCLRTVWFSFARFFSRKTVSKFESSKKKRTKEQKDCLFWGRFAFTLKEDIPRKVRAHARRDR